MARKQKNQKTSSNKSRRQQTTTPQTVLEKAVKANPDDVAARLCLGEWYLKNDQAESILETIEPIEQQCPISDVDLRVDYNRLRAYGLTNKGQYPDAEKAVCRLMEDVPDSLDAWYLLAYVHLAMREYDPSERAARKFLSLYADNTASTTRQSFASTPGHLSQVHNTLGSVHQAREAISEARKAFENAIEADERNHLPYLNLAKIYERSHKLGQAREVIKRGIRNCPQVQELRLVARSLERGATVSACMIVKNEEELLPDCLASIRDWVDEIIVVDTGSTDSTVEIAKSYGAKLFHQKWEGDFSKHRNYSTDQATSDWIFVIDADERFVEDDLDIIRRHMNAGKHRAIAVNVLNHSGKFDENVTSLTSIRLFKRELGLTYEGIVHNQLVIDSEEPIAHTSARIKHLGYGLTEERMATKTKRTIDLLEKQLQDNPDNAFAHFNYAQVLLGQDTAKHPENARHIIDAARRAVELTNPDEGSHDDRNVHLMALYQLAMTHFIIGEDAAGESYALRALELTPDYLDPILLLGNICVRSNRFDEAERYYNRYLETQARVAQTAGMEEMLLMHPCSFQYAYYGLGLVTEYRRDWSATTRYLQKALDQNPELLDANARLGRVCLELKQYEEAEQSFEKQLKIESSSHQAAVGLACVFQATQRQEEADNWLVKALDMLPGDHPALIEYALMLEEADLTGQACAFIDKMTTSEAVPTETQRRLAQCCFRLEKYDHAAMLYELLVQTETTDADLLNDLAGCYFKTEDYSRAEELYQKATEIPQAPAVTFRNLGLARINLEKIDAAAVALATYYELAPDQYEIARLLGDLNLQLKDYNTALTYYERFLQVNPQDPLALFGLSECYLLMGHRESAIMGYERVLQWDPDFTPALERLAQAREMVQKA